MSSNAPAIDAAASVAGRPSDRELIERVIAGSEDALARLYERYGSVLLGTAWHSTHDRWTATEVVQDVFLSVWNRPRLYDPGRGSLRAWLVTMTRSRAIDRARSASRHEAVFVCSAYTARELGDRPSADPAETWETLIAASGHEPDPGLVLSANEARASVARAVTSLVPQERAVIALAYGRGMTQSEVAARLGWPLGTVKTRTRRALRRLRVQLGEQHPGGIELARAIVARNESPAT